MRKTRAYLGILFSFAVACLAPLAGCQEGPAEQAGERIDNAGREVRDVVNPPDGPVEATGRAIDDAANDLKAP